MCRACSTPCPGMTTVVVAGISSEFEAVDDGDKMADPPGPMIAVLDGFEMATPPTFVLAILSGRNSARPPQN